MVHSASTSMMPSLASEIDNTLRKCPGSSCLDIELLPSTDAMFRPHRKAVSDVYLGCQQKTNYRLMHCSACLWGVGAHNTPN